jgi:hypothetical protein
MKLKSALAHAVQSDRGSRTFQFNSLPNADAPKQSLLD